MTNYSSAHSGVRKPPRTDKRQNGGKPKATGGIATEAGGATARDGDWPAADQEGQRGGRKTERRDQKRPWRPG